MQLRPLTIKVTEHMLDALGISLGYNYFNGDVTVHSYDLKGDPQMLFMGVVRNYLNEYGYSHFGLEDFLLHNAHGSYFQPVEDAFLNGAMWDRKDRLHGDFINKVMRAGTAQEAVYIKKWLHQCLALDFNEDFRPLGAAGVLVFYGKQDVTPLLEKLSLYPRELLTENAHVDLRNPLSIKRALSTWITKLDDFPTDALGATNTPSAKSFFTAHQDMYRPFFADRDLTKARRTSFCVQLASNPQSLQGRESADQKEQTDHTERVKVWQEMQVDQGMQDILWPINADNIDMDKVAALNRDWLQQLWMQVYEELYIPNPKGFTLTARPEQEDSALKFFGTKTRWCDEGEEPGDKAKIYEAYKSWCQEAPKDRILQRPHEFVYTIIHHLKDLGFEDIETEDKKGFKEFTV